MRHFLIKLLVFGISVSVGCPISELYEKNYLRVASNKISNYAEGNENFRLGNESVPYYYKLDLTPHISDERKFFEGDVHIYFTVIKEIQTVVVNQENIDLHYFEVHSLKETESDVIIDKEIKIDVCVKNDTYQKFECKLKTETLQPNVYYKLHFVYTGKVHDDMRGFYESYYLDEKRDKKWIGTTHFGQQTRRLMPCFDEPRFKAQFEISIGRNPTIHTISVSNAQIDETVEFNETWVIDHFKPTSIISTYILALMVSDFDEVIDHDVRGNHTFGILARKNAMDQVSFAYQIGQKLIREFDEWTGIGYYTMDDVEKMDIVAIPDFSAGGKIFKQIVSLI